MKIAFQYFTIVFFAVFGLVSCNPVDEDQLPPSNTSNMTTSQALQLMQGSWYLDRVEYITGPICAGGINRVDDMFSTDLAYADWKLEITNNQVVNQIDPNLPCYEFYSGGGNSTGQFSLITQADPLFGIYFGLGTGSGIYFCMLNSVCYLNSYMFLIGGKIEYLSDNELRINANNESVTGINGGMLYFKRVNQSSLPMNSSNLSGSFVHDNTKVVQSGVVQSSTVPEFGHTLTFTNEVISDSVGHRYFKCLELNPAPLGGGPGDKTFFTTNMLISSNGPDGDYLYQDYYCTSGTNLIGSVASYSSNCSIYLINSTELILRDYTICNDYEEYHLTKVN
jgi:hypothetical protein